MIEHEIEPWLVLIGDSQLAFWQLQTPEATALALFSDGDKAAEYLTGLSVPNCRAHQPTRRELLTVMIRCYEQQVRYAVLDPTQSSARRIFPLRDVLLAARQALTQTP